MNAAKYLRDKERLSQALNGQDALDSVVTDITSALQKYNLDMMPETAFDVMCFTLETIHLGKYDTKARMLKECAQ